ncbi:sporulation protein YunB [Fictibacillus sp. KIGAM418]|uniref:Sporulation protein YunB n=1 Tax=Fictibacillus marinisediminis TaxID=2878389 RepID=A0A9X2BD06_9BACL|nr:sporulation protein YunB [Fictibacillus marinisediminis]MCK6256180.1 sporulation protein YunB [Fictibacillus marinisediminis]
MFGHRMKLRKGPLPFKRVLLYSLIMLLGMTIFAFWLVDHKIEPILKNIARSEVHNIADEAINDAILKTTNQYDMNKLIVIHEQKGQHPAYSLNYQMFNKVLGKMTESIHDEIKSQQHTKKDRFGNRLNSIVYQIPLGAAFNNSLLSDVGPPVPVEMSVVGNVDSDLKTKPMNVGINNPYLEVYVHLKVNVQVVVPFSSEKVTVANNVKLGDLFLPQDVPEYYGDGGGLFKPAVIGNKAKKND